MRNVVVILAMGSALLAPPVFASQTIVSGRSSLKLSEENPIRAARHAIAEIDREVARLDLEIQENRGQAIAYKVMPSQGGLLSAQMETLATAKEMQKNDLLREREDLQARIQAQ